MAYQEAIQNPKRCFKDSDLKDGRVTVDARGWPKAATGNFAAVYQVSSPNGQQWAVKCFTREVPGLRDRYRAISDHVQRAGLPFMVQFQFLEEGIRVKGRFYPILKMQWVKGDSLNGFVRAWLHKQDKLLALAQLWLRLAEDLRAKQIGHGDLQHGNVLLVPGTKPGTVLKLIDYDGMYVPALAQTRSAERGHPNYQHPERLRQGYYGPEVDRFSHLVVYTALRCLVVEPALWDQFNNDENLLFVEKDFESPSNSRLFQRLWGLTDANIRNLVGHLLLSASRPVNRTPLLRDLVNNGQVRPLSRDDEKEIERLLASPPRPVPANNNPAVVGSGTAKTLPTVAPSPGTRPATGPIPPWLSQVPPAAVPAASAPPPSSPSTVPSRWLRWLQAAIRDPNRRGILMLAVLIPAIPLAYLFGDWLSGRLVPSRGRHLPVVATEPLNQPPGTNINQAPSVAIATTDPGEPVAGQAFTIRLQGRDPDGDSVTFEYRRVGDANWQAAPQGQVRLDRVEPGVLELEFRAVDHRGAASAAIRRAWQVPDEVRRFTGHTDGVSSVAFSPDGRYALSGSWDQTLRLWKVATGKEVRRFTGHTDWVNSVAFSPDGRYALSASWDKTLRLWEVAMGQEVHHFEGHTGPVNSVAFSPDGRYALSGSADQTLRLWEAATGQEVRRFTGHTGGVNSVAFSPDGRYALSA
ncbi:MAG TPA: WD40 repeat domain-containing serine/threonine-protein kinase, partial [Gemmataceae bacterium]|nr:WD40 repeat domain-containing serine/threonine-protein kinase [Gemmataceae bacterium]